MKIEAKMKKPAKDEFRMVAALKNSRGSMIVGAIAALLIIGLMLPVIVQYVQNEAKWSTKQKQTATAFHLAEAAVDRGLWKITESDQNWEDAVAGTPIASYSNDYTYTDVDGGSYKIQLSSGPLSGQVTIVGKGRDDSTREERAVQAIYTKSLFDAGMQVEGGLSYKPGLEIHWGPVVTYSSINQAPGDYFPRKYSKGQIVGRDTVNDSNNTDDTEYWAFQSLGDAPSIDLAYYKTQAENSSIPTSIASPVGKIVKNTGAKNVLAQANPVGSGFFKASENSNAGLLFKKGTGAGPKYYEFRNSTSVIYIDNDTGGAITSDLQNGGSFLQVEALILAGSSHHMDINADIGVMGATIPASAQDHYQHATAVPTWTADFAGIGAGNCCYNLSSVAVHGFVYVGGNVANAGANTEIVGALDILGTSSVNTLKIYYDEDVVGNIQVTGGTPARTSWKEVKVAW